MNVRLLVPPFQHNIDYPMLGVPSLVAHLRRKGYRVEQSDLNVEYINRIIKDNLLPSLVENIQHSFDRLNARPKLSHSEQRNILTYENLLIKGDYLAKCASTKYNKVRRGVRVSDWNQITYSITKLAYLEAYGTSMSIYGNGIDATIKDIITFIQSEKSSTFNTFLSGAVNRIVTRENPEVIGISLLTEYQLIPALTLAHYFKGSCPGVRVYFGGSYITATYDKLMKMDALFSLVDGIFVGEGETPLTMMLQSLNGDLESDKIPNLIGAPFAGYINIHEEDINSLCEPDFDGLKLSYYANPRGMGFYTSKGCYWGKCAFCSVGESGPYREKNIVKVLEELEYLIKKYDIEYITITDDLLSTQRMVAIAKYFIENNLNIKWDCQTRFSREFTDEICQLLKKSQLTNIAFGLETANVRMMKHVHKGISHNLINYVLTNCEKHDLAVSLNCMLGFPTETRREADDTLGFPEHIRKKFPSLRVFFNTQITRIERNSCFAKQPQKYGVEILGENELSTEIDWLQPAWCDNPDIIQKEHRIFNHRSNGATLTPKAVTLESTDLCPQKRYFSICISSKYNLKKLSNSLYKKISEIKLFAKRNRVTLKLAEENIATGSIVHSDSTMYHYIIVNKLDSRVRGRRFKVSPIVKTVFELCDGKCSVDEIISQIQTIYKSATLTPDNYRKNVIVAINQLLSLDLIYIPLLQHQFTKAEKVPA